MIGTVKPDDLAFIQYSEKPPGYALFRKPLKLKIGDKIAVIGHPLHGLVAIKPIYVTGKVRAFQNEKLRRWGHFAIDADIRRGNSGGPVIDDRGYIVGVVSAKINTPAVYQKTGVVVRDIGLIIRQDRALRFLEGFNIPYSGSDRRETMQDKAMFDLAYGFVARIGCWGYEAFSVRKSEPGIRCPGRSWSEEITPCLTGFDRSIRSIEGLCRTEEKGAFQRRRSRRRDR